MRGGAGDQWGHRNGGLVPEGPPTKGEVDRKWRESKGREGDFREKGEHFSNT